MATYKWSVKPANLISGTTLIKETDNKIQANLDDIADFINGEGEYIGQGLTFDMLDKNSSQTILGIKTFTNGIVSNVTGNATTATKLQTARLIAGTSFDGSKDIDITFANISTKPTTISGYGITDVYTKAEVGTLTEFTTNLG